MRDLYLFFPHPHSQTCFWCHLVYDIEVGDHLHTTYFLFPLIFIHSLATLLYYVTMNTWKRNSGNTVCRVGKGDAGQIVIASLGDASL